MKKSDEITFDLSKIKNFFKKSKSKDAPVEEIDEDSPSEKSSENPSLELRSIGQFLFNYRAIIIIILLMLLVGNMRLQFLDIPLTKGWASSSLENSIKQQIRGSVDQQYPNLPAANKESIIEQQWQKFHTENKAQLDQQEQMFRSQLQEEFRFNDNGQEVSYLGDIDSYFWLRYARNIVDHGNICDKVENGQCYDMLIVAPLGGVVTSSLHPYSIAIFYKLWNWFGNASLMLSSFYITVLFGLLTAMIAYLFGRKMFGDAAGIVTAIVVSFSPMYLSRSMGSDTDLYNLFFPLCIIWLLYEGMESKKLSHKLLWGFAGAVITFIFNYTWGGGWWFILDIIGVSFVSYVTLLVIKQFLQHKSWKVIKKDLMIRDIFILLALYFVLTILFIGIYNNDIIGVAQAPIVSPLFSQYKVAAKADLWPNVLTTVAEFNPSPLPQTIASIAGAGGKLMILLSFLGMIIPFIRPKDLDGKEWSLLIFSVCWYAALLYFGLDLNIKIFILLMAIPLAVSCYLYLYTPRHAHPETGIMVFLWYAGSLFASATGVRFVLLGVAPFALGVGITLGFLFISLPELFTEHLSVKKWISQILVGIAILLILLPVIKGGYAVSGGYLSNVNDAWYETLTNIRDNSEPSAIINSWWDFGHWFKYFAERGVTLDGATQNGPQLHWLGKILLTGNEDEAVGILRMLDCGSNIAFDIIKNETNDILKSIGILNRIIPLNNKEDARNILFESFDDSTTERILRYTHCENPPEDFFIASEDMIGKGAVWAHFGGWNFTKAAMVITYKDEGSDATLSFMKKELNYSADESTRMLQQVTSLRTEDARNAWISPWPSYFQVSGCSRNEDLLTCDIYQINLTTFEVTAAGNLHPQRFSYYDDKGTFVVKEYNESLLGMRDNSPVGATLIMKDNNYAVASMQPILVDSMFTRMFYHEGKGLSHFPLFDHRTSIFGTNIYTYKVKWITP